MNKEKETKIINKLKSQIEESTDRLKEKEHIKKYLKCRKLHNEIMDSMVEYFSSENYNLTKELDKASLSIFRELNGDTTRFKFEFDGENDDDLSVLYEIVTYKNHNKMTSITEKYIANKMYREDEEKEKMLKRMNRSYVGLFRILSVDRENAYVELEDIFTKKRFTIIDIGISATIEEPSSMYIYNRIISYEDISFGTGIHLTFTSDNKKLNDYIKKNQYRNPSNIVRCLDLLEIYRKSEIILHGNHDYDV